jgi:sec-independent protein translocase protein TatB
MTGSELVVILLLALVVLGPEKLPGAIRQVGRIYSELRKISNGFQKEFTAAIQEPAKEMRNLTDMLGSSLTEITSEPNESAVTPTPETSPQPSESSSEVETKSEPAAQDQAAEDQR